MTLPNLKPVSLQWKAIFLGDVLSESNIVTQKLVVQENQNGFSDGPSTTAAFGPHLIEMKEITKFILFYMNNIKFGSVHNLDKKILICFEDSIAVFSISILIISIKVL